MKRSQQSKDVSDETPKDCDASTGKKADKTFTRLRGVEAGNLKNM
jgi:hypothetical protein